MKKKGCCIAGGVLAIIVVIAGILIYQNGAFPGNIFGGFDAEGRYDSTELNYMGVIFEDNSNITAFNEGYSESDACPWGFEHNGIDYFFANNSKVLAAAPGKVVDIVWTDYGEGVSNRFHISVWIQFNKSVEIGYNFEPWTTDPADKDLQVSMINLQIGNWVAQGDEIARFLTIAGSAHIHFDVIEDKERTCPMKYFAEAEYQKLMDMIHLFNPGWDLCYP